MKRLLVPILLVPAMAWAQGDLDPAAPPDTTMKSLDQVHPGTPVDSVPVTISAPGHYYLTANLGSLSVDAITISASDVTLDLNGFVLSATGATAVRVAGTAGSELTNVVISDGCVSGSSPGVALVHACNCTLRGLTITAGVAPLSLEAPGGGQCSGNRIDECIIYSNREGIRIEATGGGSCDGNVLQSCIIRSGQITPAVRISANGGNCDGNVIRDCVISPDSDVQTGIDIRPEDGGRCAGNTVTRSTVSEAGAGIFATAASNGILEGNRIDGCTVHDATTIYGIYFSGTGGFCRGNHIVDCCVSKTNFFSIYVVSATSGNNGGNLVSGCTTSNATSRGIVLQGNPGGKLVKNHVTDVQDSGGSAQGISAEISPAANFIFHNTVAEVTIPFSINAVSTSGPVVTAGGTLPSTGTSAHPWANFAR